MSWYSSKVIYGYEISLPSGYSINEFISFTDGLNTALEYKIYSLTNRLNIEEFSILDNDVTFVIGITVDSIEQIMASDKSNDLAKYITNNSLLEGFDITLETGFYSGIEWFEEDD